VCHAPPLTTAVLPAVVVLASCVLLLAAVGLCACADPSLQLITECGRVFCVICGVEANVCMSGSLCFFGCEEILREQPPETHTPRAEAPRRATQRDRL
jgi:hypothetical protein